MPHRPQPEKLAPGMTMRGPRAAALVAVVAFFSFLPSLRAGFVYDDTLLIAQNPLVQSVHGIASAFAGHFWQTEDLGSQGIGLTYYRPLVTLSFVLNWLVFDGAAWGFHLVNVLLHAAVALLATRVALRWLGRPWLAVLVGVLFAVHPSRSESVVWIAGRTDLLMALFGLASVELCHQARKTGRNLYAALGIACLLFALLCKEGSVVLPALLLADALIDEPRGLSRSTRQYLLAAVGLSVIYLAARWLMLPVRQSHSAFSPAYGFATVATYAERLVWPWPQTFFYRNLMSGPNGVEYPLGLVAAGVALSVGYGVLLWWAFRRDRAAAACLLVAVLLLAPVLNFFETGIYVSVSDHFLYLPWLLLLLGVARAVGLPLLRIPERVLAFGSLAFGLVCLVPNTVRARDFKDDATLWSRELELNPENPVALDWLSVAAARSGQPRKAAEMIERALQPAAARYFLLAGKNANSGRHVRRVVLTAAATPDGDRDALARMYEELASFARGAPSGRISSVGTLVLGKENGQALTKQTMNGRGRSALHAELATIASRLGRSADVQHWLGGVDLVHAQQLPNPLNLVLVQARVGDYPAAFVTLQRLDRATRSMVALDHGILERLGKRLLLAQSYLESARSAPQDGQAVLRALNALELGTFVVACRMLRPLYQANPERQDVAQLYAQGLISAHLDAEAERVVSHALGAERAALVVASLRQKLPPIQRELPSAPDNELWWQSE